MGIPKFAAWLTRKFPSVVSKVAPDQSHGLYIDMNGIIHPCCHSEDDPSISRRSTEEKIEQVCLCVEHLVETVKPTTILYLAMDGVAPRAKMNQQRSRRYMAAVDRFGSTLEEDATAPPTAEEAEAEGKWAADVLSSLDRGGCGVNLVGDLDGVLADLKKAPNSAVGTKTHTSPVPMSEEPSFDSNCISPGTAFMTACSERVRAFVGERVAQRHPLWRHLCIVYSDTNSPGEGEHKLIDFLRVQITSAAEMPQSLFRRQTPSVTRSSGVADGDAVAGKGPSHVICGLDADLILLCLSLHVNDVVIMRDVKRQTTFGRAGQSAAKEGGSGPKEAITKKRRGTSAVDGGDESPTGEEDEDCGDKVDTTTTAAESGNHHQAGSDGAGSTTHSHHHSGHVTTGAAASATSNTTSGMARKSFEYFSVDAIGDCLVSEMHSLLQQTQYTVKDPIGFTSGITSCTGYTYSKKVCEAALTQPQWLPTSAPFNHKIIDDFIAMATLMGNDFVPRVPSAFCGEAAMDNLLEVYIRSVLPNGFLTTGRGDFELRQLGRLLEGYGNVETMLFRQEMMRSGRCTPDMCVGAALAAPADAVIRQAYYRTTSLKIPDAAWDATGWSATLEEACRSYIEGLRFVWQYYSCTSEACSWSWGYAFHHAPFAVDIARYLKMLHYDPARIQAPLVEKHPPLPFAQLMCILPPTSCALLPKSLGDVMWRRSPDLAATFPSEWAVDYAGSEGKEHLSTVMLPFADMHRLVELVNEHQSFLSQAEVERNINHEGHLLIGPRSLFVRDDQPADYAASVVRGAVPHDITVMSAGDGDVVCVPLRDSLPNPTHRPKTYSSSAPTRIGFSSEPRNRRRKDNKAGGTNAAPAAVDAQDAPSISAFRINLTPPDLLVGGVALFMVLLATFAPWMGLQTAASAAMSAAAVGSVAVLLLLGVGMVGAGRSSPRPVGCTLKRNVVRDTYLDWMCTQCLSRNFMRNDQCFLCHAPVEADASTWALFSSRIAKIPPSFEADHAAHVTRVRIPEVRSEMFGGAPAIVADPKTAADEADNCDMV